MKRTIEVSEIVGFNESPVAGDYVINASRDFESMNVAIGCTIVNDSTDESGTVSAVSGDTVTAAGMTFNSGDFFTITLTSDWTLQTVDGPVIDVECNICGWSYPSHKLTKGICQTCKDD